MESAGKERLPKTVKSILDAAGQNQINLELDLLRKYLIITRERVGKIKITPDVAKNIEDDYLEERRKSEAPQKEADNQVSGDDLHVWINIAKIISSLKGFENLDFGCYTEAKILEKSRLQRLSKLGLVNKTK